VFSARHRAAYGYGREQEQDFDNNNINYLFVQLLHGESYEPKKAG